MEADRFILVKPSMELVHEVQDALLESRLELEYYFSWFQSSLEDLHGNMCQAINDHDSFSNEVRYYLVAKDTSLILGSAGLLIRDIQVPFFEIGYWVRTSAAGNGYITEAVGLLEACAFDKHGAKRLEIRMAKDNLKSIAVAERCGYIFDAVLKNERRLPSGRLSDTIVYSKCSM